jgi:DNA-binding transcriptional MocR family regulator
MDTSHDISAREAARRIGTSVPRVTRAIDRNGMHVRRDPDGRVRLTQRQFEHLRALLGTDAEVPGLSRAQARVLAALARSPRGLGSARAVAARAGVSPTTASNAVSELERRGLVNRERTWIAAGKAREVDLLGANVTAPEWPQLAPRLAAIEPPRRGNADRQRRVPRHLEHLFWNTAPSQLEVDRAGGYIARRLIQTGDPDGLAWGAENLDPEAWREAASASRLRPEQRALAGNLAEAAE